MCTPCKCMRVCAREFLNFASFPPWLRGVPTLCRLNVCVISILSYVCDLCECGSICRHSLIAKQVMMSVSDNAVYDCAAPMHCISLWIFNVMTRSQEQEIVYCARPLPKISAGKNGVFYLHTIRELNRNTHSIKTIGRNRCKSGLGFRRCNAAQ